MKTLLYLPLLIAVLVSGLLTPGPLRAEESVKPGINSKFLDPKLKVERTQTLMAGGDCCDHVLTWVDEDE